MININKEYHKLWLYEKRYAKHWISPSAHRSHSSTTFMIKPAKLTLDKIDELNEQKLTDEEKLNLLIVFYEKQNHKELNSNDQRFPNSYYMDALQYLNREIKKIKQGEEVYIPKLS